MKLRLPAFLTASLLACMAAISPAQADTFLAEGVNVTGSQFNYDFNTTLATLGEGTNRFYDGGKGTYWDGSSSTVRNGASELFAANGNSFSFLGDLETRIPANYSNYCTANSFQNLTNDGGHCWAYTSSNLLQYWQSYYGVFVKKARDINTSAPVHGYTYDKAHLDKLGGTQSLKLNMLFYDNWKGSAGGGVQYALSWYLGGVSGYSNQTNPSYAPTYFKDYFPDADTTSGCNISTNIHSNVSLEDFSQTIKTQLGFEKQEDGTYSQTTKGQILYLELGGYGQTGSHAITCYGFDTDANGNITALYVTNSDDQNYALLKLDIKKTNDGSYVLYDGLLPWGYAGKSWQIYGVSSINTPEVLKNMLAEYESGNLTWMGNLDSWTNTAAVAADVNVLPTDETGWMTYAGAGTNHAGYYNSYYTTGRGVEFNDEATNSTINVAEDITVSSMTVNNAEKDYSFNGGDASKTITVGGTFTKSGTGAVEFNNIALSAASANLEGDVTFDKLTLSGNLAANGHTVTIKGDSSFKNVDTSKGENSIGTSSLIISGGTTTISEGAWVNVKDVTLAEGTALNISHGSIYVAGNLSSTDDAVSTDGGVAARYCIKVGTAGDATTGHVDIAGSLNAKAYIQIQGNAKVDGNIVASGDGGNKDITIGGNATIGGKLQTDANATIGGKVQLGADSTISNNFIVGGDLTGTSASGKVSITAGGDMQLGGNVSKVHLSAENITMGAKDGGELTLDTVDMTLTGGKVTLTNVVVRGDSHFRSSNSGESFTLQANGVTFVLDESNSTISGLAAPASAMLMSVAADEPIDPIDPLGESELAVTLASDILQSISQLSGSITLDLSAWKNELQSADTVTLMFSDGIDFTEELTMQATFDNGATFVQADSVSGNLAQFSAPSIPEPATVTLSLLALAGGCARRRRR